MKSIGQNLFRICVAAVFLAARSDVAAADISNSSKPREEALESARRALEAIRRLKGADLESKPALKAAIQRLANQLRGQPELVELVQDFQLTNQHPALLQFAQQRPADPAAAEAIKYLLQREPALISGALTQTNQTYASALVTALAATGHRDAVPLLTPWITEATGRTLADRRTALRGLIRSQEGAQSVLKLVEANRLAPDLKPLAATEFQSVRWLPIRTHAAALLPVPARAAQDLPPVRELTQRTGDPLKGRQVFARPETGCSTCHQVNGEGVDFGPRLSEIGAKLGKDALYDSILEPGLGIAFGYEGWTLTLQDGDEISGILASETAEEIVLKIPGGMLSKHRKADVTQREKHTKSLMPEGLAATLKPAELVDLIEYLVSLKKTGD